MLARVGFCPAAFSACTKVYASDMPYSTFPSHGNDGAYVASMLLNRLTHGLVASVRIGRYVSLIVPPIRPGGQLLAERATGEDGRESRRVGPDVAHDELRVIVESRRACLGDRREERHREAHDHLHARCLQSRDRCTNRHRAGRCRRVVPRGRVDVEALALRANPGRR